MGLNGKPQPPRNSENYCELVETSVLPKEVTRAQESPLYNKLPENEKQYALFTDGSCHIVGKHQSWKVAMWSPTQRVVETAEGEGESSQFAEVKAIQLATNIAEQEK